MIQIFTSYHAKAASLKKMGFAVVNISIIFPRFADARDYAGSEFRLAPTKDMLKMSEVSYYRKFDEILSKTNQVEIYMALEKIAITNNTDKVVLLCYEKDRETCHRSYVGRWLEKELGIEVAEVDFESGTKPSKPNSAPPAKKPTGIQGMLF